MTGGYLSSEDEEIKRNKSDNSSFMTPNRLPRARCESAPLGVFQFNSPWEALSVASPLSLVELESDSAARTLDYLGLDDTCSQIRIPFNERRRLSVKSFDDDLVQAPSKSLWVGNLDSNLSSQDILNLFSPYGVVESLRVLPGKECAFVNFAHLNDAVDAFQDMQGGKVGSSIILVGYAKSEQSPDQSDAEPTKSLWIGNVSPSTSPAELESLFAAHGKVESCRVLTHKNCGFVNFVTIQDAINARKNMNGKLINGGAIKINFAKVPEKSDFASLKPNAFRQLRSRNTPPSSSSGSPYSSTHSSSTLPRMESSSSSYSSSRMETTTPTSITTSPQKIADLFESCRIESDVSGLKINYATCIPSLPDVPTNRQIDQLRLREIRRKLDTNLTTQEMESLVDECLDQIVDLSIDYIGNVVVQKLMEYSQDSYRLLIIEHLSSSIAGVGIHKNGTWAIQKIINIAKHPLQVKQLVKAIAPMTPQLLLDQFGNYVIQCCLSMGSNQFIFDAMVDNMTTIASGRFGARAMRTCLDSKYTTKRQQKYVSASIISHAHELVASSNGSILVTWLLDSSLADRYQLLVAKLSGNFADLCKNKIASATIIKLASQTIDKEARSIVLGELSTVHSLKIILYDLLVGTPALTRIIASIVNSNEQEKFARQIKSVLDGLRDINWSHSSIKRLADEVKIILGGVSRSNDSFAKTSYMIATPVGF